MRLSGKTALVTGGESGIGRASAIALALEGANVAVCGLALEGAESVASEINQTSSGGGRAYAIQLSVEDAAGVDEAVRRTIDEFGGLNIVVHAAGTSGNAPIIEMTNDEWQRVIDINLTGSFNIIRAAGRVMVEHRGGTMVLISSDRGIYGNKDGSHYAASKAGMVGLVKSAALEMGSADVTVNAINPGPTNTAMVRNYLTAEQWEQRKRFDPLGQLSEPEDIAEIVLFLAAAGGRFITGQLFTTRMRAG